MKKKFLAIALALVMLLALVPVVAQADNTCGATENDDVTWSYDSETNTLTISGSGAMQNFSPPEAAAQGGPQAPWKNSTIESVVIEDGVTSIGNWAFNSCSSLTSVTIPSGVTSIGTGAFRDCESLTSVTIPEKVTSIGSYAFKGSGLTSVTIPSRVTSIGSEAFMDCTNLTSVTIPNSVTEIKNNTFSGCTNLTSVTIPSSVTSIGTTTFSDCSSLTSVTIPSSVTSIGYQAFGGCTGLTSVTFEGTSTTIQDNTFTGCTAIKSVIVPEGTNGTVISQLTAASYTNPDIIEVPTFVLKSASLTLVDYIGLNFYIVVPTNAVASKVKVKIAFNGTTNEYSLNTIIDGKYRVTLTTFAKQMADEAVVSIEYDGNRAQFTLGDENSAKRYSFTYSVNAALDDLLRKHPDEGDVWNTLATKMKEYGAAAKAAFSQQ